MAILFLSCPVFLAACAPLGGGSLAPGEFREEVREPDAAAPLAQLPENPGAGNPVGSPV